MRALIGFLFFGLVAVAAGAVGFQAGVASAVAGGTSHPGALLFLLGGPHFGGLFFLFFLFAIAIAIGGARRRYRAHSDWGQGPWGHGPWGNRSADGDPRRSWMSEMHRQMHEAEAARAAGAKTTGTGTTTASADTTPTAG
jgi:hypothetical protein